MATLWIREYARVGFAKQNSRQVSAGSGQIPVVQEPGTDQSPVTFTTSAQSAAFAADTAYVRCYSSDAFHYVVGANPTATTDHLKWPADAPLEIGVAPGQKIAVIAAA
jgi:hypothetical protein